MADITYHLAVLASPRPLPPGTNDYGPLAYLVWVGGGILILVIFYFAVRALRKLTSRRLGG